MAKSKSKSKSKGKTMEKKSNGGLMSGDRKNPLGISMAALSVIIAIAGLLVLFLAPYGENVTNIGRIVIYVAAGLSLVGFIFTNSVIFTGLWAVFIAAMVFLPMVFLRDE